VTRCTQHPNARAAWRCTRCGADLCPQCAAEDVIHGGKIVRCAKCSGVAEVLMVRKEIVPYWGMFGGFLKAIFSSGGLLQLIVLALILYLVSWIPLIGAILYGCVWVSYYFLVIGGAASGQVKLPLPGGFSDFIEDMILPLVRFILATLILWVPTFLYVRSRIGFFALLVNPAGALADPVLILIMALSVVYFPGAIITAAITRSTLAMLNPLVILGIILRIPGHYFLTVLVWGIMNVVDVWLMGHLAPVFFRIHIAVVAPVLFIAVSLIVPILTAFVLGWLIYQNGEVLGFTRSRDLLVPEVPGAVPRGVLPPQEEPRYESKPEPVEPIPLEPEPDLDPAQALESSLKKGDDSAARDAYRNLQAAGHAPDLPPELELRLANILERGGHSLDAAHACRRAAQKDLKGPLAARAIFTAARLLVERAGEAEQGKAMYRYLVENYPDDPLARRAQEMLRRLG
jgi:hypothetical protein